MAGDIGLLAVGGGLHGREGRREVLVQAQVAQMRELQVVEAVGAQSGRVCRRRKGGVVGCGARRIVRKCRRGRGGRHGRPWSRLFRHPVRVRVVVLVRVRSRHWLRRVGILGEARESVLVGVVAARQVVSTRVRVVARALLEPRGGVCKQIHGAGEAAGAGVGAVGAAVAVAALVVGGEVAAHVGRVV